MLIFYYFLKKAASLFPKETVSKWTRVIKIMTGVSAIIYSGFALESIIVFARRKNNTDPN
jgi:formate-dependent nitrite reductase membrane component NrfD